jgi:hypothetical protein
MVLCRTATKEISPADRLPGHVHVPACHLGPLSSGWHRHMSRVDLATGENALTPRLPKARCSPWWGGSSSPAAPSGTQGSGRADRRGDDRLTGRQGRA